MKARVTLNDGGYYNGAGDRFVKTDDELLVLYNDKLVAVFRWDDVKCAIIMETSKCGLTE